MNDDRASEDYRRVLATANKLETIQSNLDSVIDFFLTPIVKLYSKLCNDCLKLLFGSEFKLDYFRKAEELVWRRIYHDIYRFQKTKRQLVRRQDECLMESHFISGIGFYSTLIIKLRSHYKLNDTRGVIGPLNLSLGPIDNLTTNQRLNAETIKENDADSLSMCLDESGERSIDGAAQQWARQAIYRSLVYMGDLARYLLEISQIDYRNLAFEFYRSASMFQPDNGLPFNQLATLAGGLNHNLDAVCNYMRCCMRKKPFEGAEGNMTKIFELNKKFHADISRRDVAKLSEVLASKEPTLAAESMTKTLIVTFIKLTSDLWTSMKGEHDEELQNTIIEETRLFFKILREAIELEPFMPLATSTDFEQDFCPISGGLSSTERPRFVSPTIMYEFCSISMMLLAKYQRQQLLESADAADTTLIDLINTVALNILHYATSKCQRIITSKVQELRVRCRRISNDGKDLLSKPLSEPNLKEIGGNLSSSSQRSMENVNSSSEATSRRALSRLRQRKAATKYTDGVNKLRLNSTNKEDSDLSELEETALSTIDALEISSEISEEGSYRGDDLINLDSLSDEDDNNSNMHAGSVGNFGGLSKPALRPTRSQNYESERVTCPVNSSNSLPVPDLITGDRIFFNVTATSQSPSESICDLDVGRKSSHLMIDMNNSQSGETASNLNMTLSYVYNQTHLPTIKIFFDWLLSDVSIINSNIKSFQSYHNELADIVSSLHDLQKIAGSCDGLGSLTTDFDVSLDRSNTSSSFERPIFDHVFDGPEWLQKYPLSCDLPLLGLDPLSSVHELSIDFTNERQLGGPESGFLTIQCVEAFSHALTAFLERHEEL